ncbi:MAG: stalk domain-containing protein [Bacillota bacterium]|nr:stalk domain-containing protein [Bacillota bacterium]
MKKFIAGLIVGIIMATAVGGYAMSQVTGQYVNFNFLINGEKKTPDKTPISVNGSSYLPLRSLATLLGYDVDYIQSSNTIVLNKTQLTPVVQENLTTLNWWVTLVRLPDGRVYRASFYTEACTVEHDKLFVYPDGAGDLLLLVEGSYELKDDPLPGGVSGYINRIKSNSVSSQRFYYDMSDINSPEYLVYTYKHEDRQFVFDNRKGTIINGRGLMYPTSLDTFIEQLGLGLEYNLDYQQKILTFILK